MSAPRSRGSLPLVSQTNPCIGFFPALPLAETAKLDLGEWVVGRPPSDMAWRSERFRELVEKLIGSFTGDGFASPALLWQRERGLDGQPPSPADYEAIQAAVRFAVLDANDRVSKGPNAAYHLATAENAELYVQPIDETDGSIAFREGGALKSILSGGWTIGQRPCPLPDAVVPIVFPLHVSRRIAKAVFSALVAVPDVRQGRVRIALEWHADAMKNPRAITLQHRLIALKTGFEALLGTSDSREGARRLRKLFEDATRAHSNLLPWAGVLWSPNERVDLARVHIRKRQQRPDMRSEIEDWFMTLAEARNAVIHEGKLTVTEFTLVERPLSPYKGNLFWVGERLLREAIKARLGADVLLGPLIAEHVQWERIIAEIAQTRASHEPEAIVGPVSVPSATETRPPRPLSDILDVLGCRAANEVLLERAAGGASFSEEAAREMAMTVRDAWVAQGPSGRSVLISAKERMLLERHGAEQKLPRVVWDDD
jgi:hypothetical protein